MVTASRAPTLLRHLRRSWGVPETAIPSWRPVRTARGGFQTDPIPEQAQLRSGRALSRCQSRVEYRPAQPDSRVITTSRRERGALNCPALLWTFRYQPEHRPLGQPPPRLKWRRLQEPDSRPLEQDYRSHSAVQELQPQSRARVGNRPCPRRRRRHLHRRRPRARARVGNRLRPRGPVRTPRRRQWRLPSKLWQPASRVPRLRSLRRWP